MAGNGKMWTIGGVFDSEYPQKVRYSHGQPQNGERVTWSWEDNKSRTIATVSDEMEESLQVFLPKKPLQHQFGSRTIAYHIEETQKLCNINLVRTQLLIILKRCKTFAISIWFAQNCLLC